MTQKKKPPSSRDAAKPLRRQAEAKLSSQENPQSLRLIHDLEVHQIELEMQNEELIQARAGAEEAYRQYTDLYDFAPVGYFTLERDGTILKVNLAGANLLDTERAKLLNRRLGLFASEESRSALSEFLEKLLSGEGKQNCEVLFEKKGNGLLWARIEATCFEGGQESRVVMVDITERKQMIQALQESENRFSTILQGVPTIAVQGYAEDGTTQYWNSASERLYGYSAQEAIGRSLLDLIIPPEMRDEVWQSIQQMAKTGESIPAAELSLMRKDGSRVSVYSSHAVVSIPGHATELFCLDVDLTERKQAEEALFKSEEKHRTMFENMSQGVFYQQADGVLIDVNSAALEIFGLSRDQFLGKTSFDPQWKVLTENSKELPPEEHPSMLALKSGKAILDVIAKVYNPRKDGYVWININAIPQFKPNESQPYQVFVTLEDITERKQTEAILHTRLRLSQFADSHSLDEVLQKTLDEAEALTRSQIGFIHFLEADQKTLQLQMWSTNTLNNMCSAEGKGTHYSVDQAGVWAECVSTRAPVIHNDYASLPTSRRKGLPEGHAPVTRELVLPVLHNDLIVMIVGVGNKASDYDDNDVEILSQLANSVWDIVQRKQAEEKLQASERTLKLFVEYAPAAIAMFDNNMKYIAASRRYLADYRLTDDNIIGRSHYEIFPEIPERWKEIHRRCLAGATEKNEEDPFPRMDGIVDWVRWEIHPWYEKSGEVGGIILFSEVITERKLAEQILRQSEERFRTLFDKAPLGYQALDTDGRFLDVNQAWLDTLGYTREEVIGKWFGEFLAADYVDAFRERFPIFKAAGQIHSEFEMLHKNGSRHWISFEGRIGYELNGGFKQTHCILQDITERRKAEQALRASEEQFRAINDNMTTTALVVYVQEVNGRKYYKYVGASMERIAGVDVEDILKDMSKLHDVILPEYRAQLAEAEIQSQENLTRLEMEIGLRHAQTGKIRWTLLRSTPYRQLDGSTIWYGIWIDITERRKVEEALRESQELFSLFMHHSPIYTFIKEVTPTESRVLQASENFQEMIGITGRDMVGKTMEELFPAEFAAKITADDWSVVANNLILKVDEDLNERHYTTIKFPIVQGDKTLLAGYTIDITERVEAEIALKDSEFFIKGVLNSITAHIAVLDEQATIVAVNEAWQKFAQENGSPDPTAYVGANYLNACQAAIEAGDPTARQVAEGIRTMLNGSQSQFNTEYECDSPTKQRWFAITVLPMPTSHQGLVIIHQDITERKRAELELQYMKAGLEAANFELKTALAREQQLAHTDVLTGINNRRHLYELAEHEVEIAARYRQPLSVIMFDIDHFKLVNDTFGHMVGDQILQIVAQVASEELRSADVFGRYGGEEFVIILPMTNAHQAYPLAERIRETITKIRVPTEKGDAVVTLSLGIVEIGHGAQARSAEDLIRRADEAMYAAKQAGRNRTEIGIS